VPLVAAAVLPHPPLLVPDVAAGAAPELDELRAACAEAVARVLAVRPQVVCVLGAASETRGYELPYRASFAAWGVPVEAGLGDPTPATAPLPLSVAVGVWLLTRAGAAPEVTVVTIDGSAPAADCVRLGEKVSARGSVGLLVMGDGSACRTLKAPGYLDPRAEPFDASVTKALADADADALLALDPALADELMVAGRAPWQVLAGAANGRSWSGDVRYDDAPYGVQYTVATWLPA